MDREVGRAKHLSAPLYMSKEQLWNDADRWRLTHRKNNLIQFIIVGLHCIYMTTCTPTTICMVISFWHVLDLFFLAPYILTSHIN
jgi:hypothetical protein